MTTPEARYIPAESVQKMAHRYLVACYGESYVFRAPETFENLLERWIWAVGAGEASMAEECMAQIEQMAAARRT
jgi:hypothetical protein